MVSQSELIISQSERVITLWFLVLSQFFRDSMGPFNKVKKHKILVMILLSNNVTSGFIYALLMFYAIPI